MRAWRLSVDAKSAEYLSAERSTGLAQPLALPDKPSIAVLPFQNMSSDPEQDYFADGMVEDIITAFVAVPRPVRHRGATRASPIRGKRLTSSGWAGSSASDTCLREACARSPAGFG